jgi:hypothetical protein
MKGGALAVGIVLLLIGFFVFWIGYSGMQQYNTSLGQLAQIFSSEAQQQAQIYGFMTIGGGFLAIIGFGVTVYGAAASK